jgi:hypothetical protein
MDKVLKYRKILQDQYKSGRISKKKYEKELKWIRKNITMNTLSRN